MTQNDKKQNWDKTSPETHLQSTQIRSFALRCNVGNLAAACGVSTAASIHAQEEVDVLKPPQARQPLPELVLGIQLLSCC